MSEFFIDEPETDDTGELSHVSKENRILLIQEYLELCEKLALPLLDDSKRDELLNTINNIKTLITTNNQNSPSARKDVVEENLLLVKALKKVQLFQNLPEHHLSLIADHIEEINLKAGEPFVLQYQDIDGIYIVNEETVISSSDRFAPEKAINEVFGVYECLTETEVSNSTVTPGNDCNALYIARKDFIDTIKLIPGFVEELLVRLIKTTTQELSAHKSERINLLERQRLTREVFENMGVGSFFINETGEIGQDYNSLAEDYLGKKGLAGIPFADIAFQNNREALRDYYRALQMLFRGTDFDPEMIISILPNEVLINDQVFKLSYSFVQDKFGNVLSVFVLMKDLTLEKNLVKKEEQEKKVIDAMRANMGGYFLMLENINDSLELLVSFSNEVFQNDTKPKDETVDAVMRSLHSSKGLCGQYELNNLRFTIHQMEDWVQHSNREKAEVNTDKYTELLQNFKKELKYAISFKKALGDNIIKLFQGVTFSREEFKSLIESLESDDFQTTKHLILDKMLVPAKKIIDNWKNDIKSIADKNDKKIDFQIDIQENLKISESLAHTMNVELGHIYRNCVDHGIELPEKRKELGKPENGKIVIRILKDNDILSLIISDDGAGLDEKKIIHIAQNNPALDQKLVTKYIASEEIWRILFIKGFSSKKTISNISGRGVGLDVVEVSLNLIGGSIHMSSEKDKGSVFTIKVPLTTNESVQI